MNRAVRAHEDVEVGDKILVTKVNGDALEAPHLAEVVDIFSGFGDNVIIDSKINDEDMLRVRQDGVDEWYYASEASVKHHEEETTVLNRAVKVGDKLLVSKVNHEDLEALHLVTVGEVDDDYNVWIDIYPPINGEDTLYITEGVGDEWRILSEKPQYDDDAVIPTYSQFLESGRGRSLSDYTGVNITEESLDFEPKEEEVLRGITAESLNFEEAPKSDSVNHPSHYNRYSREVIESIKGLCTPEEFRGYLKGNIIKYSARYSGKGGVQDIDKLAKYTQFLKDFEIEMEGE